MWGDIMDFNNMDYLKNDLSLILEEYQNNACLKEGEIFVIGCSSSEVVGESIGNGSSMKVAEIFMEAFSNFRDKYKVYLAFQCCEHLNRALVVERECMEKYNLTEVSAVPHMHAGGSMASLAYRKCKEPVLVENIAAHGGIDIGDTFIGMHIKAVGVPVRVSEKNLGKAHISLIKRRPKLIGGERTQYK